MLLVFFQLLFLFFFSLFSCFIISLSASFCFVFFCIRCCCCYCVVLFLSFFSGRNFEETVEGDLLILRGWIINPCFFDPCVLPMGSLSELELPSANEKSEPVRLIFRLIETLFRLCIIFVYLSIYNFYRHKFSAKIHSFG